MVETSHPHELLLFVYGTLKRGHCRHYLLREQTYVGEARTLPQYRMYNCGKYPALVESANGLSIHGELWRVSAECLAALDDIEGVDVGLYKRDRVWLSPPYHTHYVEAYLYCRSVAGLQDCGDCW